jgi:hypothetical protein
MAVTSGDIAGSRWPTVDGQDAEPSARRSRRRRVSPSPLFSGRRYHGETTTGRPLDASLSRKPVPGGRFRQHDSRRSRSEGQRCAGRRQQEIGPARSPARRTRGDPRKHRLSIFRRHEIQNDDTKDEVAETDFKAVAAIPIHSPSHRSDDAETAAQ